MNKKNYKKNLKRSFIICGIMFVVILLIFAYAVSVNNKVAENMTGRLLYTNESELYVYDFDNKENVQPEALKEVEVEDACFINASDICAAVLCRDKLQIIKCSEDSDEGKVIFDETGVEEFINLEADRGHEKLLAAYKTSDNYTVVKTINISDGTVNDLVSSNEKDITFVCFNYNGDGVYMSAKGKNTLIYSDRMELLCSVNGDAVISTALENGFIISKTDEYRYYYKFYTTNESESKLKFCNGNNTYALCQLGDNKFIAGSDKNGNGDIYVCNGSNMDPVDAVNNDLKNIPLDYIQAEGK